MHWKKSNWMIMTALSALLLSACSSDSTPSIEDNNSNIEEQPNIKTSTINFTLQDAINHTVQAYTNIMDVFTQAGIEHNTDDMKINENIYEEIKGSFSTYATKNYIEHSLKEIALHYCYSCDNTFIPRNPTCAVETELNIISEHEAVLISKYNRNFDDDYAMEESILLKIEDGQWKIDQSTMQQISLNLDVEKAKAIFEIEAFTGIVFADETMLSVEGGSEEIVFIFDTNEGRYAITQNDGYIVEIS